MNGTIERLESRTLLAQILPDPSFGGGEIAAAGHRMLEVLPNDKVLAGDNTGLTRFNSDGSIDATFNDASAVNDLRQLYSYALNGDRIMVVGRVLGTQGFAVRALRLETGELDTSFGVNGTFIFTPQPVQNNPIETSNEMTSMIATSDGDVVIAVTQNLKLSEEDSLHTSILFKIGTNGKLVASFGDNGALVINQDSFSVGPAQLAPAAAGKFLALNATAFPTDGISRYNSDGTLDASFGQGGTAPLQFDIQFPYYEAPFVQPDGKILIPADSNPDSGGEVYLIRLNADGSPDQSFADNGLLSGVSTRFVKLDSRGRILGVGGLLFRLTPNGQLDPTFDEDGLVAAIGVRLAVDSSDRIVVATGDEMERFAPALSADVGSDRILEINGTFASDTLTATISGETISVSLNGQTQTFAAADVDAIIVNGFGGNDIITNDCLIPATLRGGDGSDTIFGGSGADRLHGGPGNDSLWGGDGVDKIFGEDGVDSIYGNGGNDRLEGGAQGDHMRGNGGRDMMLGNGGHDRMYGGASGDRMYGQAGNDRIFGEGGNDRLYGDDGETDTLSAGAGNDVLISVDSVIDQLFGDGGRDAANADASDLIESIEESL